MSRTVLRTMLVLFAIVAATVVVGCGDDGESSGGGGSSDAAAQSDGKCDARGAKVALVLHLRIPFTAQVADGAQVAADECNADMQITGPQNFDGPAAVSDFRNALAAGAKGAVVVAQPGDIWRRPIDIATQQGVPVAQTNVAADKAKDALFVGIEGFEDNKALGDAVADKLGPDAKGDVIVGTCQAGLPVLDRRYEGIKAAMAEKAPGVTVKPQLDVTGDPSKNFQVWRQIAQANPDALAFIGVCAPDLPNLVKIKQADKGAKYLIAGNELEPGAIKGLESDVATATLSQNAFLQGYLPMRMVLEKIAMDRELPKGWVTSSYEVVTPENVEDAAARLESPEAAREHFSELIDKVFADPSAAAEPISALYADR